MAKPLVLRGVEFRHLAPARLPRWTVMTSWPKIAVPAGALVLLVLGGIGTYRLHDAGALVGVLALTLVFVVVVTATDITEFGLSAGSSGIRANWKRSAQVAERMEAAVKEVASTQAQSEEARRAAIERLMTQAAEWGYLNAGLFSTPPIPHLSWDNDGQPIIEFGEGKRRTPLEMAMLRAIAPRGTFFLLPGENTPPPTLEDPLGRPLVDPTPRFNPPPPKSPQ